MPDDVRWKSVAGIGDGLHGPNLAHSPSRCSLPCQCRRRGSPGRCSSGRKIIGLQCLHKDLARIGSRNLSRPTSARVDCPRGRMSGFGCRFERGNASGRAEPHSDTSESRQTRKSTLTLRSMAHSKASRSGEWVTRQAAKPAMAAAQSCRPARQRRCARGRSSRLPVVRDRQSPDEWLRCGATQTEQPCQP